MPRLRASPEGFAGMRRGEECKEVSDDLRVPRVDGEFDEGDGWWGWAGEEEHARRWRRVERRLVDMAASKAAWKAGGRHWSVLEAVVEYSSDMILAGDG